MLQTPIQPKSIRLSSHFIILFGLILLPFLTSCSDKVTIVHGQQEKEANEILDYLDKQGIKASKERSTEGTGGGAQNIILWDIAVNADQSKDAVALLNFAGLPRRRSQTLLGVFGEGGLVPTDLEEKIKYQRGLGEDIASTIRKIDGIIDSEVHISFPEDDPLNPDAKKDDIKASVYIKHTGVLDDPTTNLELKLRRLVSNGVPGLKFEHVTVVGDRARYADLPVGGLASRSEADKEYVNVWTLIIAKESLTRFRIVFFALIFLLLISILLIVWVVWKFFPLLQENGGIKKMVTLEQLSGKQKKNKSKEKSEEENKGADKNQEEPSSEADLSKDFEGELDVDLEEEEEEL